MKIHKTSHKIAFLLRFSFWCAALLLLATAAGSLLFYQRAFPVKSKAT